MRNEMKGPGNIDNILSNLGGSKNTTNITLDKDSTISIEDLDNLSVGGNKKRVIKEKVIKILYH